MQALAASQVLERVPISLVDDDILLRRSLQLLLRSSDYDVRAYATPEALLADAGTRSSACLITDLGMPKMDGITLLGRLRSGGWHGPAILITSSTAADLAGRAADAGFHSVLVKPLVDHIILDTIRRAVEHGRQSVAASAI